MYSKEEYKIKLQKQVENFEEKLKRTKKRNRLLSEQNKYLKKRTKELTTSRDNWKEKCKSNRLKANNLECKITRWGKAKGHHFDCFIVALCIQLRIVGGCSYECICKILVILQPYMNLELSKIPCANTIQNWVSKLGLYELEKEDQELQGKAVSLIIDESIRLGKEKQLVVLSVPLEKEKQVALGFEDVKVLHIQGATSWTGDRVNDVLEKLKEKHGFMISNILSDEDTKLKKVSRLQAVTHLPDISHAIGTCLKKTFEKVAEYQVFTKLIGSYKSKGVNQDLSYLLPPKQRGKARFMNQGVLVKWAQKLLERFDRLNEKEKSFFKDLKDNQSILNSLENCLDVAKKCSLPFKTAGLSNKTLTGVKKQIESEDRTGNYVDYFLNYLQGYLNQYQQFIEQQQGLVVHASSEIIESLFGKFKSKANNYALTGLTQLNLELPLYGLNQSDYSTKVREALKAISMTRLETWINEHSTDSQLVKRSKFFNYGT
jgi:hypothetical protein